MLYTDVKALMELDYKGIFDHVKKDFQQRIHHKRMFENPEKYYLDNLIYSIQASLQELDSTFEEYDVLFKTLVFLDEERQKFDIGVRREREKRFKEEMLQKEKNIKELGDEYEAYKSTNKELLDQKEVSYDE